jgi:hypothetical protein
VNAKWRPSRSPSRRSSIGGPIGKPGGSNKLFFFYSHEYRPTNNPINGGNPIRLRVPTAAERAGDFSQTLDNNGALFNLIHNPASASPCTTSDQSGCFADGGVLGRIPASALYQPGIAVLNHPHRALANSPTPAQPPDRSAQVSQTVQQPAIRLVYQLSSKVRVTGEVPGQRQAPLDARARPRIHRRAEPVPRSSQLRGDGQLHDEPDDVY